MGPPRATFHGFIVTQSEMGLSSQEQGSVIVGQKMAPDGDFPNPLTFFKFQQVFPDLPLVLQTDKNFSFLFILKLQISIGHRLPLLLNPGVFPSSKRASNGPLFLKSQTLQKEAAYGSGGSFPSTLLFCRDTTGRSAQLRQAALPIRVFWAPHGEERSRVHFQAGFSAIFQR